MPRIHNFSAGPSLLPEAVIKESQAALWELNGSGIGLCESSHRWPIFEEVIASARARLHALLRLDDDQEVLFLHGGAQSQFYQIPMNLLRGGRATYLDTGKWSTGSIGEAQRYGQVDVAFTSRDQQYADVPDPGAWGPLPAGTKYLHYTSNNTVSGTQFSYRPDAGDAWLICDMSSDICSAPVEGSKFDLIYAGAQKNLGPSGVTIVIIRKSLIEQCDTDIPTMLQYGVQAKRGSMQNTPNTFGIFMVERICAWIEAEGGLEAIGTRNRRQAKQLYDIIDGSDFWQGLAAPNSRSLMNVCFTTGSPERDTEFWQAADAAQIKGLKGHKSRGGLRATIYNAQTDESVAALANFMADFEKRLG